MLLSLAVGPLANRSLRSLRTPSTHRGGTVVEPQRTQIKHMSTQINADLVDDLQSFLRKYYDEAVHTLAQHYPSEQRSLTVDWMDLYQFDPDVAEDFVADPGQMQQYLDEALQTYDLPAEVGLSKATVRVTDVPDTHTYDVGSYRSDNIGQYLGIYGQVSKKSQVKPQPIELVFECQRCGTENTIPQAGDGVQEPHECQGCERQGPFRPNYDRSEFQDFQLVRVQQPPEQTKGGQGASVDVRLTGDLVGSVDPGDRVNFNGIMSLEEPESGDLAFDPYISGRSVTIEETDFDEIDVSEHEEEIIAIANGEHGDPYDLLVESIAPKIEGMNEIKEAIALQLFGGVRVEYPDGSVDRGDSHILLLGDPGTAKSSLLRAVEEIAPRSTYASGKGASAAGMTAAAVPDNFGDKKWSLEAGALVLADKGVACVDEIDKIDDDARSSLHDALESQRVTVNKAGINAELPAQTSLLAAGNPKHGRFEEFEAISEQIELGPTLLSRFDLMFMLNDQPDEERDREIIEGIVDGRNSAIEYTADPHSVDDDTLANIQPAIDRDTLRAYIAYAKQHVTPRIKDSEVEQYLIDSYTQLRLANGEDEDAPVPVTFRKLEGIMRLAEASARVRLSNEVEKADVERAQRLIGRSMQDVGYDPDEGTFDADVVETGTSKAQRDRIRWLKEIISELQSEHDNGVPKEEVIERALEQNNGKAQTLYDIKKLKNQGEIYEPVDDHYRTT